MVLTAASLACLMAYAASRRRRVLAAGIAVSAALQMSAFCFFRSDAFLSTVTEKFGSTARRYFTRPVLPRDEGDMRFRTAFALTPCRNVAMHVNRPGVQTYHSIQENVAWRVPTLADSAVTVRVHAAPCRHLRSFYALMSVRDFLCLDGEISADSLRALGFRPAERGKGWGRWRNTAYVPMGFTYDRYVTESLAERQRLRKPMPDVALLLLSAMAVPDSAQERFRRRLAPLDTAQALSLDSVAARRRAACCRDFRGTTRGFTATVTLPRENYVFFSVPANPGFTATVDGRRTPVETVNLGLAAVLVPEGRHSIEFAFCPPGLRTGAAISLAALLGLLLVARWEKRREPGKLSGEQKKKET